MNRYRNEDGSYKEIPPLAFTDNLGVAQVVNELIERENARLRSTLPNARTGFWREITPGFEQFKVVE